MDAIGQAEFRKAFGLHGLRAFNTTQAAVSELSDKTHEVALKHLGERDFVLSNSAHLTQRAVENALNQYEHLTYNPEVQGQDAEGNWQLQWAYSKSRGGGAEDVEKLWCKFPEITDRSVTHEQTVPREAIEACGLKMVDHRFEVRAVTKLNSEQLGRAVELMFESEQNEISYAMAQMMVNIGLEDPFNEWSGPSFALSCREALQKTLPRYGIQGIRQFDASGQLIREMDSTGAFTTQPEEIKKLISEASQLGLS